MKVKSFQDLKVWEESHQMVLELYKVTQSFPSEEKFGLVSQLGRSASSICANIAEGYMKSNKDFRRYLDICRGSLEETKYFLILSKDLGYLTVGQFERLFIVSDNIGKILYKLKQSLNLVYDHQ